MTALTQASIEEMREISTKICREYLSGAWKTVNANSIKFKRISGGLSNFLYYVSLPDSADCNGNAVEQIKTTAKRVRTDSNCSNYSEPKEVLVRIYGQVHGEHALESMVTESVVFTLLSERNLGPRLHGIFPGGRIEEYIPAKALQTNDLSDNKLSMKIAEKMAEIHSLNIPLSKKPDWLWNSMNRWLNTIDTILSEIKEEHESNANFKNHISVIKKVNFKNELKWVKSIIDKCNYPVVFCHNDLQEGNILHKDISVSSCRSSVENLSNILDDSGASETLLSSLKECNDNEKLSNFISNARKRSLRHDDSSFADLDNTRDSLLSGNSDHSETLSHDGPELLIIDYEYCAYNYRGYDIANHLMEWTFDYTSDKYPFYYHYPKQYPSQMQRYDFINVYLKNLNRLSEDPSDLYEPTEEEIKMVDEEIRTFLMVTHLFWCLWSVVNVHQNIEFGYWEFALCRLNEYKNAKEQYLKHLTAP